MAIAYGAMSAGELNSFAPNYSAAVLGAARLFKLFQRQPLIDPNVDVGSKLVG